MDFNTYQINANKTAVYPDQGGLLGATYTILGLANEAGEVAGKFKKLLRDKQGKIDNEFLEVISKELGDTLWYLAQTATELGLNLDDVAQGNNKKLFDRAERGVLKGDGDER